MQHLSPSNRIAWGRDRIRDGTRPCVYPRNRIAWSRDAFRNGPMQHLSPSNRVAWVRDGFGDCSGPNEHSGDCVEQRSRARVTEGHSNFAPTEPGSSESSGDIYGAPRRRARGLYIVWNRAKFGIKWIRTYIAKRYTPAPVPREHGRHVPARLRSCQRYRR
jgi:hypothetical protein